MRRLELQPNDENASAEELVVAMEAAPNRRNYIRMAAIHAQILGFPREQVAQLNNRSDRMLHLWIHQFNEAGIDGLISRSPLGRPRIAPLQRVENLLITGQRDPSLEKKTHLTGVTLHGFLREKLTTELGCRTVIRWLHELNVKFRVPTTDRFQSSTMRPGIRRLA